MGASGFGVVPVDGIVMNVLVVEIEKRRDSILYAYALFAWLISRTLSTNKHYFSLTTNQPTLFSTMAYQPSEQGNSRFAIPSDKDEALTNGHSTAKDISVYLYIINRSIRQTVAPR